MATQEQKNEAFAKEIMDTVIEYIDCYEGEIDFEDDSSYLNCIDDIIDILKLYKDSLKVKKIPMNLHLELKGEDGK